MDLSISKLEPRQLLDGYKLDDLDVFQKAFEQLKLREKAYQKLLDQ